MSESEADKERAHEREMARMNGRMALGAAGIIAGTLISCLLLSIPIAWLFAGRETTVNIQVSIIASIVLGATAALTGGGLAISARTSRRLSQENGKLHRRVRELEQNASQPMLEEDDAESDGEVQQK